MRYRFDGFEIDARRYELRRDGASCRVEPLVFDLLHFLARHPGRVLTRDEIVREVWQGRSVSDATIAGCVKAARRALGDSGEEPTYIRTVRGRGFEFIAQVTVEESAVPAAAAPAPEAGRRASGASSLPVLAVLPFANLSAEADEYFADGLTEDIITNLSRFRDLRVIAGASTFPFKGRAVDLQEIHARLNAGYAVQGSVRRAV
ncbi:MAG: winged helix-turn-helix domain-containing protein, partial [Acetobacteraceae bacterium]|nr:winged helix-turn-helix domain-containing protein [Acetobacteraceae bacterium]